MGNALPELTSLTEMVRVMMEDRECQEREIAEERERRNREVSLERERRDREIAEECERMDRLREEERRRYHEECERPFQTLKELCSGQYLGAPTSTANLFYRRMLLTEEREPSSVSPAMMDWNIPLPTTLQP
jgi:hypothetical protein